MEGHCWESQDPTRFVAQKKKNNNNNNNLDVSGKFDSPATIPHRKKEREPGAPSIGDCMVCQGATANRKHRYPSRSRTPTCRSLNAVGTATLRNLISILLPFFHSHFDTGLCVRLYSLLCPWVWHLYRLESLHVPRHLARAVVVRDTIIKQSVTVKSRLSKAILN